MSPIWFDGICDTLFAKVQAWHDYYDRGKIRATRKFLDTDGLKDVPVKYAHEIPLTRAEGEALVRIMKAKRPRLPLTEMLEPIAKLLRPPAPGQKGYPMKMQGTTPAWVVPFGFYKPEVREILKALEEAKAEAKNTTIAPTLDQFVAEKKKQGGRLWDVGNQG